MKEDEWSVGGGTGILGKDRINLLGGGFIKEKNKNESGNNNATKGNSKKSKK